MLRRGAQSPRHPPGPKADHPVPPVQAVVNAFR